MKAPQEVTISTEEGETLIERIEHDAWSADDRWVVVQVLTLVSKLLRQLGEGMFNVRRGHGFHQCLRVIL